MYCFSNKNYFKEEKMAGKLFIRKCWEIPKKILVPHESNYSTENTILQLYNSEACRGCQTPTETQTDLLELKPGQRKHTEKQ